MIVNTDIKALIENAKTNLADLVRRRDQLNVDIIRLQNDVRQLSAMVWRDELTRQQNDNQQAIVGITDAVRSVLRLQSNPMTAGQVKSALDMMGYYFKGMTNPSSVVHNTLKRMYVAGELMMDTKTKTYRVATPLYSAFYKV